MVVSTKVAALPRASSKPASKPKTLPPAPPPSRTSTATKVGLGVAGTAVVLVGTGMAMDSMAAEEGSGLAGASGGIEQARQAALDAEPNWAKMGPLKYVARPIWKVYDAIRDFFLRIKFFLQDTLPWVFLAALVLTVLRVLI